MFEKFFNAFWRKNPANETNEEFNFHLEKEIEKNVAAGMTPEEARRQALIAFGGVQQARELVSEVRWTHWLQVLRQDGRYAFRMLGKSPLFTAVVVLTLAVGIGMNTAIFSLINSVLFRRIPVRNSEELVLLRWEARHRPTIRGHMSFGACSTSMGPTPGTEQAGQPRASSCSFSTPWLKSVESEPGLFTGVAGFSQSGQLTISGNGPATVINGATYVSGEFFSTLGVTPAIGRTIQPEDDTPTSPAVVMLGYGYWQTAFGGRSDVIGKTVLVNRAPFSIVGVTPNDFNGLTPGDKPDLWFPFAARPQLDRRFTKEEVEAGTWWIVVVGRLKPGVSRQQAEAALNLKFRAETMHGDPPFFKVEDAPALRAQSLQSGLDGGRKQALEPLYVLMLAVALVLVIACANIGGILLARATRRSREIAVRLTLGARRTRILSQLLVEGLLLSMAGGFLAILFGKWSARLLVVLAQRGQRGGLPFSPQLDSRVFAFTFALSILTTLAFSLAPALRSLRVDLTPALKSGSGASQSSTGRGHWISMGNLLVVSQITLAIVALVGAGLLTRTLTNLKNVDVGFNPTNVLVFGINPSDAGYKPGQLDQLNQDIQQKFAALPGVRSVTYSWMPPLGGGYWDTDIHLPGTPESARVDADFFPVGRSFFKSMQLPLKAGRDFSEADFAIARARRELPPGTQPAANSAPMPVIVNEAFITQFFHGQNPIGQHVEEGLPELPTEHRGPGYSIVGICGNAKYEGLRREIGPTMYAPSAGDSSFLIRTAGDPKALVPAIRGVLSQENANLAMSRIATESENMDEAMFVERLVAQLSTFFALLAVLLACAGIYGLLSYEVTRRTREIGIRIAIGASRTNVVAMVIRHGLVLAVAGAVIGAAASLGATRVLSSLLYQVKVRDPLTIAVVSGVVIAVSLFACWLPARRATKVDPLVALRYE